MKHIIRFILLITLGFIAGIVIAGIAVIFIKGVPVNVFIDKLLKIDFTKIIKVLVTLSISSLFALYFHIIVHEGGHLVCGLATGYKFVSFRIFSWTLIKEENKYKIKKFSLAGTGGQCLLEMPDLPEDKLPVVWYNIGGVLGNIIFSLLALAILLIFNNGKYVSASLIIFIVIGLFLALTNGIPMKIQGISNDAANVLSLRKHPEGKIGLKLQLSVNAQCQRGVRLKDMPEDWFIVDDDFRPSDTIDAGLATMTASRYIDIREFDKAYDIFNKIIAPESKAIGIYVKESMCEMVFLSLLKGDEEKFNQLYTKQLEKYINQFKSIMSSKMRILFTIALLHDNDKAKAEEIYNKLLIDRDKFLMKGEVEMDLDLMKEILTKYQS